MSIFSAKRNKGQKVCYVIQGDIPGNSIDKICVMIVQDKWKLGNI